MLATIHTTTRCWCGYRNRGVIVGTLKPRMRDFTLSGSLHARPPRCMECGAGLADRPDQHGGHALDPDTLAWLDRWRQRQRDRQQQRKRNAGRAA